MAGAASREPELESAEGASFEMQSLEIEGPHSFTSRASVRASRASTARASVSSPSAAEQTSLVVVYMATAMGMNFFMKYVMSHMALHADPGRLNGVSEVNGFPGPIFWTSTQQAVAFVCATGLLLCHRLTDGKLGYSPSPLLTWQAKGQVALLSVFYAVNIAMNNLSVSLLSLTANNIIRSCTPFTTSLCATLMFGNTMCFEEWAFMCLGMVLVFVSVLAGASGTTQEDDGFVLGSILCFISTFAGAGMLIIVEVAGKAAVKLNALDSTCYMSLPAAIVLLPAVLELPHMVSGGWAEGTMEGTHTDAKLVRAIDDGKLWFMMVVSGIFAALYNALQFVLVQRLSSTQTSFASLTSKGLTVLIDCFFIKKFNNPKQFWALVLSAIGGLACFALFSRAKSQRIQQGISSGPQRRREITNGMLFLILMGSAGVLGSLVASVAPPGQPSQPPPGAPLRDASYHHILSE